MPVLTKINTNVIADDAVTSAKIPADAIIASDLAPNITLTGDYVGIPAATTTERDALTPAVGMMLYNTTLGIMQQYNATGWASIDAPPTVSSFTYPGSSTALDPAGDAAATIVISGTNFQTGLTVTIDSSAPGSITRNSSTQITIVGTPAKAAATYTNGLVVTNPTGLSGSVDIAYDIIGLSKDASFDSSSTLISLGLRTNL